MKLLWTKSSKPLSKMIRWVSKEPCSHFAISFDDKFVFHSDLTGAHPTFFNWFMKSHEVVHTMAFDHLPLETEDLIWDLVVMKFDKPRPYDWGAFMYFLVSGLAHRLFNKPMPSKNIWADSSLYLCTELASVLTPILNIPDHLDLTTPEQLWLNAKPK